MRKPGTRWSARTLAGKTVDQQAKPLGATGHFVEKHRRSVVGRHDHVRRQTDFFLPRRAENGRQLAELFGFTHPLAQIGEGDIGLNLAFERRCSSRSIVTCAKKPQAQKFTVLRARKSDNLGLRVVMKISPAPLRGHIRDFFFYAFIFLAVFRPLGQPNRPLLSTATMVLPSEVPFYVGRDAGIFAKHGFNLEPVLITAARRPLRRSARASDPARRCDTDALRPLTWRRDGVDAA